MAGIFVGPMNLKITKCKGEEKGLCLAPARYYPIPRVDWDNKPDKHGDARDHMTPEQIEFHKENSEFYSNFQEGMTTQDIPHKSESMYTLIGQI